MRSLLRLSYLSLIALIAMLQTVVADDNAYVVLGAKFANVDVGSVVDGNSVLKVEPGGEVTLIDPSGKVATVSGPFKGEVLLGFSAASELQSPLFRAPGSTHRRLNLLVHPDRARI